MDKISNFREKAIKVFEQKTGHKADAFGRITYSVGNNTFRYFFSRSGIVQEQKMRFNDGHVGWTPLKKWRYEDYFKTK